MRPKVTLRKIIGPLLISYAIGLALLALLVWFAFSQGEQFPVKSPQNKDTFISFGEFIQLGLLVVFLAFVASAFSLVVSLIPRIVIISGSVVVLVALTFAVGPTIAVLWLAAIIANIALYRGRSRLYVMSLGVVLFLSQIFNVWTRTGDPETFAWLIAIDIAFAAPIFFVILNTFLSKTSRRLKSSLDYQGLLATLTEETLELGLNTPIIVIDGRACSGKSTLAKDLQNQLFKEGDSLPRVIHLDDLYPGWDGLAGGVDYLKRLILNPLKLSGQASWQEFDWSLGKRDGWREFSGGTPLIIEGCGALNSFTSNIANLSVWLTAPEQLRRERWLAREGNLEKFDMWSAQELDFIALEKSDTLAKYFYDSSATP